MLGFEERYVILLGIFYTDNLWKIFLKSQEGSNAIDTIMVLIWK